MFHVSCSLLAGWTAAASLAILYVEHILVVSSLILILLDLHTLGVLPPGLQEEVLDLLDLTGHLLL